MKIRVDNQGLDAIDLADVSKGILGAIATLSAKLAAQFGEFELSPGEWPEVHRVTSFGVDVGSVRLLFDEDVVEAIFEPIISSLAGCPDIEKPRISYGTSA